VNSRQRKMKRVFDICLSAIGLVVLSPLIIICVLIAAVDTKTLGVFRQLRVGQYGVPFHVYKIRTMFVNSNPNATTVTTAHDSRISPTGRILRRFKLDELPQLWNVLIGQMSFVGPRPDVPGYADNLVGRERNVLKLRPGITGPATIKYSNEEEILGVQPDPVEYNDTVLFPDKVKLNIDYYQNYSLWDDMSYILMTLSLLKVPQHLKSLEVTEQ